MGDSFQNMNKNTQAAGYQPASSGYAQEGGGEGFLKSPFETGGDYDPQENAKQFIGA
jgi:hypothetical protein